MMKRGPQLDFSKSTAQDGYWFLYWIGKLKLKSTLFHVDLYFVRTTSLNDDSRNFVLSERIEVTIPAENLFFFSLGCIFDLGGNLIARPSDYASGGYNYYTYIPYNFHRHKKMVPLEDTALFPLPSRDVLEGFTHYFSKMVDPRNRDKRIKVITPIYTICSHFFFTSTRMVNLLLNCRLNELIDFKSIRIDFKDGRKIGRFKYNNLLGIHEDEILKIGKFLFFRDKRALASLMGIGSYLYKEILNDNRTQGFYPVSEFPFSNEFRLIFNGKRVDLGDESFMLIYRIVSCELDRESKNSLLLVDAIEAQQMFETGRKQGGANLASGKIPKNKLNVERAVDIKFTTKSNPGNPTPQIEQVGTDFEGFSIDVPIKVIESKLDNDLPSDAVDYGSGNKELTDLTTNLDELSKESESLRSNFYMKSDIFDRYEYIKQVMGVLINKHAVDCKIEDLKLQRSLKDTIFINYLGIPNEVMLVELTYKTNYFYIVEFRSGFTGFVYDTNLGPIDPNRFRGFLLKCIEVDLQWSEIKRKSYEFTQKLNICIGTPMKHQSKDFESKEEVITHGAGKINDRIKELVS